MAIIDLLVKSASSPQLSADNATVQHQVALLLQGDYTKWAWLSFSAATPPIYSLLLRCKTCAIDIGSLKATYLLTYLLRQRVDNYRPVSLTSLIGKACETVIRDAFLADRTNGRAIGTELRLSDCL